MLPSLCYFSRHFLSALSACGLAGFKLVNRLLLPLIHEFYENPTCLETSLALSPSVISILADSCLNSLVNGRRFIPGSSLLENPVCLFLRTDHLEVRPARISDFDLLDNL